MSCVVLIAGVIGCGKTTLIKYLEENRRYLGNKLKEKVFFDKHFCRIILDELFSIKEQAELMQSLKGWKCFRADLLMASEHFIGSLLDSKFMTNGPLTERSLMLLEKLKGMNGAEMKGDFVFLSEDNFYYRSMRYEWFQLSRRANIGFCEVFVDCPLEVAISRNSTRGYNIPEDKIKRMQMFMEYPDPEKYKWEKFSMTFKSSSKPENESVVPILALVEEAAQNPAEMMIMSDKIHAQSVCSKNVIHQADKILRKSVSKAVSLKRGEIPEESLASYTKFIVGIRQRLLALIKSGEIEFSSSLLDRLKTQGIAGVREELEETVSRVFELAVDEQLFQSGNLFPTSDNESQILMTLKALNLNNSSDS